MGNNEENITDKVINISVVSLRKHWNDSRNTLIILWSSPASQIFFSHINLNMLLTVDSPR